MICKYFLPFCVSPSHSAESHLGFTEVFNCDEAPFVFSFVACAVAVLLRNVLKAFPPCSPKGFTALALRTLSPCEFFCLWCEVRLQSRALDLAFLTPSLAPPGGRKWRNPGWGLALTVPSLAGREPRLVQDSWTWALPRAAQAEVLLH